MLPSASSVPHGACNWWPALLSSPACRVNSKGPFPNFPQRHSIPGGGRVEQEDKRGRAPYKDSRRQLVQVRSVARVPRRVVKSRAPNRLIHSSPQVWLFSRAKYKPLPIHVTLYQTWRPTRRRYGILGLADSLRYTTVKLAGSDLRMAANADIVGKKMVIRRKWCRFHAETTSIWSLGRWLSSWLIDWNPLSYPSFTGQKHDVTKKAALK